MQTQTQSLFGDCGSRADCGVRLQTKRSQARFVRPPSAANPESTDRLVGRPAPQSTSFVAAFSGPVVPHPVAWQRHRTVKECCYQLCVQSHSSLARFHVLSSFRRPVVSFDPEAGVLVSRKRRASVPTTSLAVMAEAGPPPGGAPGASVAALLVKNRRRASSATSGPSAVGTEEGETGWGSPFAILHRCIPEVACIRRQAIKSMCCLVVAGGKSAHTCPQALHGPISIGLIRSLQLPVPMLS
jgi:hypothetical protein